MKPVENLGKPLLGNHGCSVPSYSFACLSLLVKSALFFFFSLTCCLPKLPLFPLWWEKLWPEKVRCESIFPVFAGTKFSLCLQFKCGSRFHLNVSFSQSREIHVLLHMKIRSPTFMLHLKLPIQYYNTHYVFMHVVCHHLYLLRAPTVSPSPRAVISFPYPPGLSWHSEELCVFNRLSSVPGPRMKTMHSFCNYLVFFVIFFSLFW